MTIFKGNVDSCCDVENARVYENFECTLNDANIIKGSNKFFIIQILFDELKYYLWTRYGRVGKTGIIKFEEYNKNNVVRKFISLFKSKTGNDWNSKFKRYENKYVLIDIEPDLFELNNISKIRETYILNKSLQNFLLMICEKKNLLNTTKEYEIDTQKFPLGKLSQSQIKKGHSILNKIARSNQNSKIQLSSIFWSYIPYSCGHGGSPPIINDDVDIKQCRNMLHNLKNIEITIKLSNAANCIYESFDICLEPINIYKYSHLYILIK